MKKVILHLLVFIFALSLFAQPEPTVKFYLNDGSIKNYYLSDIDNFYFINSNLSYQLEIYFHENNLNSKYDTRDIDSISFENNKMMIASDDKIIEHELWKIESINFVWNTCEEIQIGNQIWMCKNLDVDHYRNGDLIPQVTDSTVWGSLTTGAWCYYNNDSANCEIYGKLYNWYAVNDFRGLTPAGWHVPSDWDWAELEYFLGGDSVAGGKLKSTGTLEAGNGLWKNPNIGATNESGFSAHPGGVRAANGNYLYIGNYGFWWSSTEGGFNGAWGMILQNREVQVIRNWGYLKVLGYSVRCVKN